MKQQRISKKAFQLTAAVFFLSFSLSTVAAQSKGGDEPFHQGSNSLSLGLGLPVSYSYGGYGYNPIPTIALMYDRGIIDEVGPGNIGVGAVIALNYSSNSGYYASTNFIAGVRGTYHLTLLTDRNNKFDPYAGVTIGFRSENYKNYGLNTNSTKVRPLAGAFVGAKYNFSSSFGAFAEAGYDFSLIRGGISFNF